jgi:ATP diphosphatase
VLAKIREEVDETESALAKQDAAHVAEEIGDLLFAVVNLARFVKTDPEAHLRAAIEKFRRRFDRMVEGLNREGTSPERATLDEMDRLWEEAKREERKD